MNVQICPHCKKEIPIDIAQMCGLHVGCFGKEIDVWFIALPEEPEHGFYECKIDNVVEILKEDAQYPYLIKKTQMTAGEFHNLPEFDGF